MDPKLILTAAVAVVMVWYALGILYNLRHGEKVLRWMQAGLPRLGEKTTFRWLGSTVAELVIAQARGTAKRAEILVALPPRDVPWNWALAALRGRKDVLILRLDLQHAPHVPLELADPKSWTGRMGLQQAAEDGWQSREYHGQTLMAPAGLLDLASAALDKLEEPARRLSPVYVRFALRKDHPHLEVHIPLPDPKARPAEEFFDALQALAKAVVP